MGNHESFPTDFHGDSYDSYVVPIVFPHRLCQDTDPHHGDGDHAIVLIGEEDLGQKLHHVRVLLVSKRRLKVPKDIKRCWWNSSISERFQNWFSIMAIFFIQNLTNNWSNQINVISHDIATLVQAKCPLSHPVLPTSLLGRCTTRHLLWRNWRSLQRWTLWNSTQRPLS